ncbi:hypothetical protein QTO02_26825, partial [Vibrio fortis]
GKICDLKGQMRDESERDAKRKRAVMRFEYTSSEKNKSSDGIRVNECRRTKGVSHLETRLLASIFPVIPELRDEVSEIS